MKESSIRGKVPRVDPISANCEARKSEGRNQQVSLGARVVPSTLHERLQFERYPIHDYVRREAIPAMGEGFRVLDAGSGRLPEQYQREEILRTGAELKTIDLFAGEGVDIVGNITAMPFEDGAFDMVLCTQVLEHVSNPREVCKELFRVLKPGGIAVITAPQSAWLHNLPYHFFHFTRIGLSNILEEAGFTVRKIEPQGGHFVTLALHLHYTVRVFEETVKSKNGLIRLLMKPVQLFWRICFGFLFKSLALVMDRWFPFEGNTQGWNVTAVRELRADETMAES